MKPECICLIVKSNIGLEIIRIIPGQLFKRRIRNLPRVSLPFGAMEGDFISSKIDRLFFASYIFLIPSNEKAMPASLTAVFKKDDFYPEKVKSYFKKSIAALRDKQKGDFASIANSMPEIYQGYLKGRIIIKSTTTTSIRIGPDKIKSTKRKVTSKENIKQIEDDLWDEDEEDKDDLENEEVDVRIE